MKTTIISLFTAALLGVASSVNGRSVDAAELVAIAFTTGLVAWTISQYSREPRRLVTLARPVRLAVGSVARHAGGQVGRLAA